MAGLAFRLDVPPVSLDDPLYDREADTGTGELRGFMESLERREQPTRLLHFEARAVVADEELRATFVKGTADRDKCVRDA